MNQDMVFWGVIIALVGSIAVVAWLFYVTFRNATKDKNSK
ncbi:hypothetical protein TK5_13250 [Sideroxyarcus sp. TK5]|jgi:hypothetical protein